MSYDIYFIRTKKVTPENIDEFLESEPSETDEHFVSKELMNEVKAALEHNGLKFKTFEGKDEDYLELNFETYQLSMFNSQLAVSLPFWDVNAGDPIQSDVNLISEVLNKKGFTAYDPQTGTLFTEPKSLASDFRQVNETTSQHFSQEDKRGRKSEAWRLIKLGLFFVLIVFLIRLGITAVSALF